MILVMFSVDRDGGGDNYSFFEHSSSRGTKPKLSWVRKKGWPKGRVEIGGRERKNRSIKTFPKHS